MFFLVAGVYGIALSLLIFSSLVTPVVVDLFVSPPYTLGTHGADWEYWHGVGCAFAGIVCLSARSFPTAAKLPIAGAGAFLYGVWGLQNLYLVLATTRYDTFMWLHVLLCLATGIYGVVTVVQLRVQSKGT